MQKVLIPLFALIALGLSGLSMSVFTVDQRAQAIVLRFGQPKGEIRNPGLHFKLPFVEHVVYFDRRILSVDPEPEQVVIASSNIANPDSMPSSDANDGAKDAADKEILKQFNDPEEKNIEKVSGEPIIVDTFARYKIIDPLQFLKTLKNIEGANARLQNILNDATRAILGKTTLKDLLSKERTNVMEEIKARVNRRITQDALGIELVDVRIVRADLTSDLRSSTVKRMISELQERATQTRAQGAENAQEIKATAEKERTILLADADKTSQIMRGEGDKEAIQIYAKAFNKDKEFYSFIRSMEAYSKTLADPNTQLVLSPNNNFFKYFDQGEASK